MMYINDIYHDSIVIFSSENIMIFHDIIFLFSIFLIFSNYQPLLLLFTYFLIHAYLTQTAQVPKLLDGAKILPKILTLWVERNNITDHRHRRTAHAIKRT